MTSKVNTVKSIKDKVDFFVRFDNTLLLNSCKDTCLWTMAISMYQNSKNNVAQQTYLLHIEVERAGFFQADPSMSKKNFKSNRVELARLARQAPSSQKN